MVELDMKKEQLDMNVIIKREINKSVAHIRIEESSLY